MGHVIMGGLFVGLGAVWLATGLISLLQCGRYVWLGLLGVVAYSVGIALVIGS